MPQAGSGQKRRGKEKAAKRERESQVRRNSRSEVDEMQKAKYLGFPNCSQAQNFVLAQAAQGKSKGNAKENAREMRLIRELDKLIVDSITRRIKSIQLAQHIEKDVKH